MPSKTIHVSHHGGIDVGYKMSSYDASKPTCVLINSMCTTTDLYNDQFASAELSKTMNLLAIEPLGHGATVSKTEHFTYWDTAAMALQAMEALGIKKAFALGTSQGGFVVTRMALLAPDRIQGIIPLGSSMDYESSYSRSKGCWAASDLLSSWYERWSSDVPTPDWVVEDEWCGMVAQVGFGAAATQEMTDFWTKTLKDIYKGDMGRKKARMAVICLLSRDGLHMRLKDIKCPVYWLQGTEDYPFGLELPKEEIKMFTNSVEAKLEVVQGGTHYLNASNPKEVEAAMLAMVNKYHKA